MMKREIGYRSVIIAVLLAALFSSANVFAQDLGFKVLNGQKAQMILIIKDVQPQLKGLRATANIDHSR